MIKIYFAVSVTVMAVKSGMPSSNFGEVCCVPFVLIFLGNAWINFFLPSIYGLNRKVDQIYSEFKTVKKIMGKISTYLS